MCVHVPMAPRSVVLNSSGTPVLAGAFDGDMGPTMVRSGMYCGDAGEPMTAVMLDSYGDGYMPTSFVSASMHTLGYAPSHTRTLHYLPPPTPPCP